ncbi:aromatic hydrocarbon degradation protein [Flavobacterium sufflavum]|uniref:Aromatic hydrocarbon degradation protein n=1 Tax=Flavobacterium sufflavum TaxID=1921138 RepID=A0A437L0S3_9FLAO|nr:aromatic hydrocarbon degradation protein [Flavobacterium sufflavum]RVT78581.1 aromatic hydrocarbon degradation protein [Flavobacterium sufflavum]
MKNTIALLFFLILGSFSSFSQSLSSSPYSIFGLGSLYDSDFGSISAIGSSGVALPSNRFINNLNPASLGFMYQNHFLFDVGGKAIQTSYQDLSKKESRNNVQFSHIAFAFPLSTKSAVSVALKPYSSAGFKISDYKLPIQDSNEEYTLSATGTGGLNNLDISYGYRIGKKGALGLFGSVLFGSTKDNREYVIANSVTTIDKESSYNGVRLNLGGQFKVDSTFTIGVNLKSPSKVNATKVQSVITYNANLNASNTVESQASSDVDDYYLPFEFAVGINKQFKNKLNVSMDYEKAFWKTTDQADMYGNYLNQEKFKLGFSYRKGKNPRSYFDRIQFSTGINYDTGFLEVDNKRIENKAVSFGISLPIENTFSALNISYSYGQKGRISNGLIKENYHKISINLSLDGIWFVKRKFE